MTNEENDNGRSPRATCSAKYAALLLLAREMALELRMRCNESIHHEQLAEILRLMDEAGISPNNPAHTAETP